MHKVIARFRFSARSTTYVRFIKRFRRSFVLKRPGPNENKCTTKWFSAACDWFKQSFVKFGKTLAYAFCNNIWPGFPKPNSFKPFFRHENAVSQNCGKLGLGATFEFGIAFGMYRNFYDRPSSSRASARPASAAGTKRGFAGSNEDLKRRREKKRDNHSSRRQSDIGLEQRFDTENMDNDVPALASGCFIQTIV